MERLQPCNVKSLDLSLFNIFKLIVVSYEATILIKPQVHITAHWQSQPFTCC